jgi:hypothetical protein
MNLVSENITSIIFTLFLVICISIYLINDFKKLKTNEIDKLNYIFLELETEKKIAGRLKNTSNKIQKLEVLNQSKFLKINVDIFNLHFTLSEILN